MLSAALTIGSASVVTVGCLVLMGWELNMFESMTLSLAVGLSIDFAIHLGVAYKLTETEDGVTGEDVGVERILEKDVLFVWCFESKCE